jgi:hypothetical protein
MIFPESVDHRDETHVQRVRLLVRRPWTDPSLEEQEQRLLSAASVKHSTMHSERCISFLTVQYADNELMMT